MYPFIRDRELETGVPGVSVGNFLCFTGRTLQAPGVVTQLAHCTGRGACVVCFALRWSKFPDSYSGLACRLMGLGVRGFAGVVQVPRITVLGAHEDCDEKASGVDMIA